MFLNHDLGGGGEQLIPWNWIHYFSLCPLLSLAIIILMMMTMMMMMVMMMMMGGAEMCVNEW